MQIRKISVIGAGTMGTQISLQIVRYRYDVSVYARNPEKFQQTLEGLRDHLKNTARVPTHMFEEWEKGSKKVGLFQDLRESLQEADLVIEALSENLPLKRKVFAQMDAFAPQRAILATTSSSIPISHIENATRRGERCLNLHFYQRPFINNMVDIMGGTQTTADVMGAAEEFIRSIGCIPLILKHEILGFGFARILHSMYQHALFLWATGYVDFRDIDRGWMIFMQMPQGPFGLMDAVGLDVVYDLLMVYYNESKYPRDLPPRALKDMIERKELGRKTGRGFYTYPHPEYARPDFLNRVENHDT